MKKVAFIIVWIILIVGCRSNYEITYKKQMKEAFIDGFKLTYFQNLFYEGFNRPEMLKQLFLKDGSGYSEPLLSAEDLAIIDSCVNSNNKQMSKDSIDRIGRVSEGAEGKHVLSYTLSKYNSKWLDSLAKARYKIFLLKQEK